ncbi:MAG: cytochrome c biosis protein CcmG, thiol:disulfide interchange protein DsbE [Thermoleophilaceae bacterium]|nr:cytochrome c biosis protein CcmG, thiol:disulfide interchange protein DsbE [Thermoleophilaceae bacterium]
MTLWAGGQSNPALYPWTHVKRLLSPIPLAVVGTTVALLALLAYGVLQNSNDTSIDDAVARGQRVASPALTLPRLDGGGSLALASLRGQVVVLNFWASWCQPCRDESPLLERWQRRIKPQNATVLGVDLLDLTSDARAFVRQYKLSYPIVRDGPGAHRRDFGVIGYPETLVIDRRGRIAAVLRQPVTEAYLKRTLPPLLRERQ